jgi:hypothetical protein
MGSAGILTGGRFHSSGKLSVKDGLMVSVGYKQLVNFRGDRTAVERNGAGG